MIALKGSTDLQEMHWSMDSKSMIVSATESGDGTLLHVDLNGDAQRLWHQSQSSVWGFPSPDGRHLAIGAGTLQSSVWMISNF
jgi:hypothetical protein